MVEATGGGSAKLGMKKILEATRQEVALNPPPYTSCGTRPPVILNQCG